MQTAGQQAFGLAVSFYPSTERSYIVDPSIFDSMFRVPVAHFNEVDDMRRRW